MKQTQTAGAISGLSQQLSLVKLFPTVAGSLDWRTKAYRDVRLASLRLVRASSAGRVGDRSVRGS